mgnify:CR=1 FL=1
MTPEEKFLFDLEGYLVVKNALSPAQVDELNALGDEQSAGKFEDNGMFRTDDVSRWGPAGLNLIDNEVTFPYMIELLGPKVRIDHDYCIFMHAHEDGYQSRLHGGPYGGTHDEADHWYRYDNGVMRNGLTVFTYCLAPAGRGDGGFACIPGSHKSNFVPLLPNPVRHFEEPAHYVYQPVVEAGDCIIFTEALVHGTQRWMADHERRALLFKYSPGHSSWSDRYYDSDSYEGVTDCQRRLMAAPSIGRHPLVERA